MKRIYYLAIFIVVVALAQPQLPPEQHLFIIQSGGKTIGWFGYELSMTPTGWKLEGETFMSAILDGEQKKIRYKTKWELDAYMVPQSYSLDIFIGDKKTKNIGAKIIGDSIVFIFGEETRRLGFNRGGFILETNLLDGWILFSKMIDPTRDEASESFAFSPQLGKTFPMRLSPGAIESESRGKVRNYIAEIAGMKFEFYSLIASRQIVQWDFPMHGLKMFLDDNLDKKKIEQTAIGVDILKDTFKSASAPMQFLADAQIETPQKLKSLSANVQLKFERGTVILLESETQDFKGIIEKGSASGIVTVKQRKYVGKKAMSFPVGPIAEPIKGTLESDRMIESKNDAIILLALALSDGCPNVWCVAKNINRFIADSIQLDDKELPSSDVLSARRGNSLSHAYLCCAMLRSIGIPARIVGGFILDKGLWVKHNWVMVWLGKDVGWLQLDPSTGEDEDYPASRILLWDGDGNLDPTGENTINIVKFELD